MHNRRKFLQKALSIAMVTGVAPAFTRVAQDLQGKIVTVTGAITPRQMGVSLIHEHVMSTFGQPPALAPAYDTQKLFAQVVPYLKKIKSLGCQTIVECTAAYFGRAPETLRQLAQQADLQILTNTGYYGAADDRYVPKHAYAETAEALAGRWTNEWLHGIDGTDIRPGFIKTAVDGGTLSEIDAKLVRAAAKTHLQTGLTTACHTGDNREALMDSLDILAEEGVSPRAWIWTHAHQVASADVLWPAARRGVWISLDGVRLEPTAAGELASGPIIEKHLQFLTALKQEGYLSQVLISHDGNSFPSSSSDTIRPYDAIFTHLVPMLLRQGFTQQEIDQLLISNPQRAFTVRIKRRS